MKLALTAMLGDQPRVWPIERSTIRIGRARSNTIQIPYGSVSREHAELLLKGDRLFLRDLRSRNGTLLNGARVRRPVEVRIGDSIRLGSITLRVSERPPENPVEPDDSSTATVQVPLEELLGSGIRGEPGSLIRILEKAGRLLVQHRSLEHTCEEFLKLVETALPASRLVLFLREDFCMGRLRVVARSGGSRAADPLLLSEADLDAALRRRTAALAGAAGIPFSGGAVPPGGSGRRCAVGVPILHEGQAIGLLYADPEDPGFTYGREGLEVLTLFANMAAVRIANDRLMASVKKHAGIDQELMMATQIQRWLLPDEAPRVEGYEFHGTLEPCEAVGGDFYDMHATRDGGVWLMVGDVEGKGICAAILMSLMLSSARVLYDHCAGPATLAARLNAILSERAEAGRFVTAFIGRLNPGDGSLLYVNAGHPAPLVLRGRMIRLLHSTGTPLGVVPDFEYEQSDTTLDPGTLLALFTDGVPEARRRGQEFFGTRRMVRTLRGALNRVPLDQAGRSLIREVDEFLPGTARQDDLTLLLVRRGIAGAQRTGPHRGIKTR